MSFLTFIEIVEAMVKVCIFYFKRPKISLWSSTRIFVKKSAKTDIQKQQPTLIKEQPNKDDQPSYIKTI